MKLVCVLADTQWSIGRVHSDIAKGFIGEYEFVFHHDACFYKDNLIADFTRCDIFLTTPNLLGDICGWLLKGMEPMFHKILVILHYYYSGTSIYEDPHHNIFTYCTISEAITRALPTPILFTPSGINPSFFEYRPRNGEIQTLGWCGNLALASKRIEWSYKIANATHVAVSLATRIPFESMKAWYHTIDVFIVTAGPEEFWETGPLPPFEAILSGVPVISTRVGNVQLLPGPKFSTIEEAVNIINDLKKNPAYVIDLAKEQYDAVLRDWTVDKVLPKWRVAFEHVISRKPRIIDP